MRIGQIRAEVMTGDPGRIRCRVAGRTVGANKIMCNVEFVSGSGATLATMSDVEMYAASSE